MATQGGFDTFSKYPLLSRVSIAAGSVMNEAFAAVLPLSDTIHVYLRAISRFSSSSFGFSESPEKNTLPSASRFTTTCQGPCPPRHSSATLAGASPTFRMALR